jgi:hypothetical protein
MTIARRDGGGTPFSNWIRDQCELDSREFNISVQDNDFWVHRFSARKESARTSIKNVVEHLQLIEVKAFSAGQPFAQKDTFDVIDRLIRRVSVKNGRRYPILIDDSRSYGRKRSVRWLGVHLLQMSGDRPDNSGRIVWDRRHEISEEVLIELLRFDRDPDSPFKFLDTRRHHLVPEKDILPKLLALMENSEVLK